jgi:hypothetical protein
MNTNAETNVELQLCIQILMTVPFTRKGQSMTGFDIKENVKRLFDAELVEEAVNQVRAYAPR